MLASAPTLFSSNGGKGDAKQNDLARDTKDYNDKNYRVTTDYGVKQSNNDDWLKVVKDDQQGPMLLEDPVGREKVGTSCYRRQFDNRNRFIGSITNEFLNELFMLEEVVLLARSS
jgi:hypothetical protein